MGHVFASVVVNWVFCWLDGTVTVGSVDTKGEAGETQKEMAHNGRVIQNCVYAPNPYHECTEACLQRIKETKPGKLI